MDYKMGSSLLLRAVVRCVEVVFFSFLLHS